MRPTFMETKKPTTNDYLVSIGGVNFVLVREAFGAFCLYRAEFVTKTTISAKMTGNDYQATKQFSVAKGSEKVVCTYKAHIMQNPTEHFAFAKAQKDLKITVIAGLLNIEKQQGVNNRTFNDDDIDEIYNLVIKKARLNPKNNLRYL